MDDLIGILVAQDPFDLGDPPQEILGVHRLMRSRWGRLKARGVLVRDTVELVLEHLEVVTEAFEEGQERRQRRLQASVLPFGERGAGKAMAGLIGWALGGLVPGRRKETAESPSSVTS